MASKDSVPKHTVCLIVVGDEILRGQVADSNTMYLAGALRTAGVKFCRVIVVPDIVDEIVEVLREASKRYTTVFTSGGVGPTHDDVTYEAVAKCLGLTLQRNEELVNLYRPLLAKEREAERLTVVPTPCEIVQVEAAMGSFAVIKARNVYSLPGSPKYFHPAVDTIVGKFADGSPLTLDYVDVASKELSIVRVLANVAKRWEGRVAIGSYPDATRQSLRTRISFEGESEEDVAAAKGELLSSLAKLKIGEMSFTVERARRVVDGSSRCQEHVKNALDTLEQCYDKYKPNEIFLSFNGGKDCTVVLYLAASVAKLRGLPPLLCLYVTADSFPEVEDFVEEAKRYYGLELIRREQPLRSALDSLLNERGDLRAGLMGVRKGDPGSNNLEPFAPTDKDWPSLMRVNPILSWTYNQVWDFILEHNVPYCSLYDQGYTSIGTRGNTTRNLLLRDPENPCLYLPAYTLRDDAAERQGRE